MRRSRRTLLLLALLLFAGVPTAVALLGDVDDNGFIDGDDASRVLEAVIGTRVLTPTEEVAADVDGTGVVGLEDAVLIEQFVAGEIANFPPRVPEQSGPIAITRAGDLVGVVNPDTDTVTFLETAGDTVLAEVPVGREPTGVAFTRSGDRALVTNARDASVSVVDTSTFMVVNQIPVGVEPFAVVMNFRGDLAYVTNMASGTLSVVDLATETVVGEVAVGLQPQAAAVTADSGKIYVTHLKGGEVSAVDAGTLAVTSIPLADIPFDELNTTSPAGVPNRMKGIAIHPTSGVAWLPHILSNSGNFSETLFNTTIFPAISMVDTVTDSEIAGQRMTLFSGLATVISSPEAIAFSPDGSEAFVVSAASDDLTAINTTTRQEVGLLRDVGDNPRGIVVTPDGGKAYVFNRLTPQVSVVDLATLTLSQLVPVGIDPLPANIANGRRLFFTSSPPEVAKDRFFGCEACHFDGRDDGQTWFFTNGPRQTLSMAGGTNDTGLLHHNGDRQNVQDFAFTFTRLQNGTGVTADQLDDLAEFVNSRGGIRFLENPFLDPDLKRSDAARRGRRVFEKADCGGCHRFPFFTDAVPDISNPVLHNVGIFAEGTGSQDSTDLTRDQDGVAGGTIRPAGSFESTFLLGVWATPPFLHDGRAQSLLDVLTTDNAGDLHGVTSSLTAQELDDLVAYMQELDITNSRVRIEFPADASRVAALTEVRGSVLPDVVAVDVYVDGAGPIAAVVGGGTFTALVPSGLVPAVGPGTLFDLTAIATAFDGEPGRDDVEVEANFGAGAVGGTSTVDASPTLITADGVSTSTVVITPRDGAGDPVGTGLSIEAQATDGSLGAVVDVGDGTYEVVLTSSIVAGDAVVTANEQGGPTFTDDATVTFAAGDVDPATSSVSVAPGILEADGIGHATVTVVPRDAFSNSLGAGQSVSVAVDLGSTAAAVDQGDGTYTAVYTAATTSGTATFTADVNAVEMNQHPTLQLVPDVTAPDDADLGKISFATPIAGVTQITGGAGSVEPLADVVLTNLATLASVTVSANADGSFSAALAVLANQAVSIRVDDLAGNMSALVQKVPFPVAVYSIAGIVQAAQAGGGFAPLAGVAVEVDIAPIDVSDPNCVTSFTPVFAGGDFLTGVTGPDGHFEIILPSGFIPDPSLAVLAGPDNDLDGFVDDLSTALIGLVNDVDTDLVVDDVSTAVPFAICFNDQLLCEDPPTCSVPGLYPETNFTPDERANIETTLRDATTDVDFTTDFSVQLIADDIFFDPARDPADEFAYATFKQAAETPGEGGSPVVVSGTLSVPSATGDQPLVGALVELSTLSLNPLIFAPIAGANAVTDSGGNYAINVPGFVTPGSSLVLIVDGQLSYDGAGQPGPFTGLTGQVSLGAFAANPAQPTVVDVAGRVAISLIEIPAVPIVNFSPVEIDQLTTLCRSKIQAAGLTLPNQALTDVFNEAFDICALDVDVQTLLAAIADAEGNDCNLSANPSSLEADGHTQVEITVEPIDQFAQRVGADLLVSLASDLGQVTSPAIDDRDGLYTAYLRAPTAAGVATVDVTVDGTSCPSPLAVTFTPDLTAPPAPNASQILFIGVGGAAVTVIGLPGSVEPFSQVTVENTTLGTSVVVTAGADGSFRADLLGAQGNNLLVSSTDGAGNASTGTGVAVGAGTVLPAIANPAALGAATGMLTPIGQASLGVALPPGFTFLRGFHLGLQNGDAAVAPLQVLAQSTVPVPAGHSLVLAQVIDVAGTPELRVVAPALSLGGLLLPQSGAHYPGVIEPGDYAYLANQNGAFLYGAITGSRGPILDAEVTADISPFVDLSRADGTYLLYGESGQNATVGARVTTADAPDTVAAGLVPFPGAVIPTNVALATRADRSFAFTGRFTPVGGITENMHLLPSDRQLYVALRNLGDIEILDTETLSQVSLAADAQTIADFAFTGNEFEAFIGYFNRVRDFTVKIEEPGLLISGVGYPRAVAITPDTNFALVASSLDNASADSDPDALFFIDTFSNVVEPVSIPVDADPTAIAINRDGTRAYVASATQGTVTVIDVPGRSVLDVVALGTQLTDVVTDETEFYVADAGVPAVVVVDAALAEDGNPANEVLASIPVGNGPTALALTPDQATLLVTEQGDDTVSAIDVATRSVTDVWAVTDLPPDIEIRRDGTAAYVLDRQTSPGVLEIPLADTDTVAPRLVDVGPRNRPTTLLQDSPVEVVFSERMDPATLTLANIQVVDEFMSPIAGSLEVTGGDTTVVFTPDTGVRYLLNSHLEVQVGTGVTDAAGNPLQAPDARTVPTITMQLPNLALISVDLTTSGIEVNGDPGAVEPKSRVEVTNLLTTTVYQVTAMADGSFHMLVQGLDNDGYELVTSLFSGRAKTDPVPLPVSFTIAIPDPLLVTYQPGPAGTLQAVGAPGAVDPQSSLIRIRNLTSGQSFTTSTVQPDGSFALGVFANQGDSLDLTSTILGAIVLDPVPLASPNLPAPVIDFVSPEKFTLGDAVTLSIVGTDFGSSAANVLLQVKGQVRTDFTLGVRDEDPSQDVIQVDLASGTSGGDVKVTVAGQTSNSVPFFAELASNTSPFAEEIISSFTAGDPNGALGENDATFVDLGEGGQITLRLGSTVFDGSGNDFQVFEDTTDGEDCYEVLVSASSGGPFDSLGQFCGTKQINLSGHGPIRFVQIVDAADGGNAAHIGAVFAIRVQLSLDIAVDGQPLGPGAGLFADVSATPSESDTFVCPEDTKNFSVTVSPAPTGGGGYGGGCSDTITWSATHGTVNPANGASTTYTAPMMGGVTDTVKVTVNRTGNCTTTGTDTKNITVAVVVVESVEWVADTSPLDANSYPVAAGAIGKRIYPDRDTAAGADKDKVKVRAKVKPAHKDVPINFKLIDPDDPAWATAPVDGNDSPSAKGGDNYCSGGYSGFVSPANNNFGAIPTSCTSGIPKEGKLAATTKNTDASGNADVDFQVSWQPGNNFRVAAACKAADLNPLTNDNVPPDPSKDGDAANAATKAFKPDKGNISDLLTVWRKLRVELDSMGAPPANVNAVTGAFTDFVGVGNKITAATEIKGTSVVLGDGSGDLDNPLNRPSVVNSNVNGGGFQNGALTIANAGPLVSINPVTANGNARAQFAQTSLGNLYFHAEDNDILTPKETMFGLVTEIEKVGGNYVYTLNILGSDETPIDWPDFLGGGEIQVGGGAGQAITAVDSVNMKVTTATLNIPFKISDDDVLPADVPQPDSSYIAQGLARAHVTVDFVSGQNSPSAAFKLNSTPAEQGTAVKAVKGQPTAIPQYWTVTVFTGHSLESAKDNDPNNEGTYRGEALFGIAGTCTTGDCGVFIAEEDTRDWLITVFNDGGKNCVPAPPAGNSCGDPDNNGAAGYPGGAAGRQSRRAEIFNHEVGHLLRLVHGDGVVANPANPQGGVMDPSPTRQHHDYTDVSVDKIRRLPNPI